MVLLTSYAPSPSPIPLQLLCHVLTLLPVQLPRWHSSSTCARSAWGDWPSLSCVLETPPPKAEEQVSFLYLEKACWVPGTPGRSCEGSLRVAARLRHTHGNPRCLQAKGLDGVCLGCSQKAPSACCCLPRQQ